MVQQLATNWHQLHRGILRHVVYDHAIPCPNGCERPIDAYNFDRNKGIEYCECDHEDSPAYQIPIFDYRWVCSPYCATCEKWMFGHPEKEAI